MTNGNAANHWRAIEEEKLRKRIAELEFKVKLGDQFKERSHYVAKATQEAWEETVGELKEENQRLRDGIKLASRTYMDNPYYIAEVMNNLVALLGGGENG